MRKFGVACLTLALCLPSVASQAIEPEAAQQISTSESTLQKALTENNGFKTIVLNSGNKKLTVGNSAVITYPTTVKLKKKGCQNIPISYKTYLMDDYDYIDVQIVNDADLELAWQRVYETPYYSERNTEDGSPVKIWKKTGKAKIKICRETWFFDGDPEFPMVGASKGTFQLYVETDYWRSVADIKFIK